MRIGHPLLAAVLLGALVSCVTGESPRLSEAIQERARGADPSRLDFERCPGSEGGLIESLFAVDQWVFPGLEIARPRAAFLELCAETDLELGRRVKAGDAGQSPEELASAFLRVLARRHYSYEEASTCRGGRPDSKVVSYALIERRGCCGTFSLLCLAYLERRGVRAGLVCLPDHCLLRVQKGDARVEIETTDFRAPVRWDPKPLGAAETPPGTHYGESLEPSAALWHYFVDRLWNWLPWRATDPFALEALKRAKAVIGSTCQSLESQEARRYALMSKDPQAASDARDQAWQQAEERFRRLCQWHPTDPGYAEALADLNASRLDRTGSPRVLSLASGSEEPGESTKGENLDLLRSLDPRK